MSSDVSVFDQLMLDVCMHIQLVLWAATMCLSILTTYAGNTFVSEREQLAPFLFMSVCSSCCQGFTEVVGNILPCNQVGFCSVQACVLPN